MRIYQIIFSVFLGIGIFIVCLSGQTAYADEGIALAQKMTKLSGQVGAATNLVYAAVLTGNVPVYASPWDMVSGTAPVRYLGTGYLWVSLSDPRPVTWGDYTWYKINPNEYVSAQYLSVYSSSRFQGMSFLKSPQTPIAWMVFNTQVSVAPGEVPTPDAPVLHRYEPVIIHEIQSINEEDWYRVGDHEWVKQQQVGVVFPSSRPEDVGENDLWVDINLYEQTVAAYEGDRMVYATLMSSGLPQWPTVKGLFRIWAKVGQAKMSGRDGLPDYYYLEDVPWTMYFHQGYALHGAYWHDRFGFQHSHGCVNLAPQDAQWLYHWITPITGPKNWTRATADNPGVWVWVH